MAIINFPVTVPDAKQTEVLQVVSDHLGYQLQVRNVQGELVNNPQTRKQFLDAYWRDTLKNAYYAGKANAASTTAFTEAQATPIT